MAHFKIGCQTYSWEMLGGEWQGTPEQILDSVAEAGYSGIEFSNAMIGAYLAQPAAFAQALKLRGLACAAFAYARNGFTDPAQEAEDLTGAVAALQFCAYFSVPLCLGGPSSPDRTNRQAKMAQTVRFYTEVARMAKGRDITLAVHPHSHFTSLVLTAQEYDELLEGIAPLGIGFNPDTGHILRGGQDLMACLKSHRSLIRHVHIKDVDASGVWKPLGKGITPLAELLGWLEQTGYAGWVVIEEESGAVRPEPSAAITANRKMLRDLRY
jgi:sugar phosphate isomerase/epimerase